MDTKELCVNHPERPAQYQYERCGTAICFDCMEITKGKRVCQACDQILSAPSQQVSAEKPYYAKKRPRRFLNPQSLPEGALYGLAVGLTGALIWEKIAYVLQAQIGLINIGIGFLVGACVVAGARRGGLLPGLVSGLLMSGSMFAGHFLLANDLLTTYAAVNHVVKPPLTVPIFTSVMRQMSIGHWLYAAAGVVSTVLPWTYEKWRIV